MNTAAKNRSYILFLFVAISSLSLLLGLWWKHNATPIEIMPVVKTATIFDRPRIISAFRMIDDQDKPFTLDNFKGHYSLVFFGFTHCPYLCPTTLAMLNQSYKMMQREKLNSMPRIIFISVDPEQDTPAVIKTYLSSFNSAFLGATGSKADLDKLTEEMSVLYTKVMQPGDNQHYTIDHSGAIILVNPQGQFQGVFTTPHDAKKIADDMKILIGSAVSEKPETKGGGR